MDSEQVLVTAEAAAKQGDFASAEQTLTQAWPDMTSAPPDARHLLGMVRVNQNRLGEAEQLLRSAIRSEPDSLRHHIALGHILSAAFNPAGAADAYAEALKIDSKWPGLLRRFSHVAYRAGRAVDAERAARQLIAEEPSADAWNTLSCALREQNKGKEALEAADQSLKLAPDNAPALNSRAAALMTLGRHQEALDGFEALAARGVQGPTITLNRAAALEKLGRKYEADAAYADAAAHWPQHPRVRQALAARAH